ncbi:unnamed protein product [Miscanthus lutarioriparius]|nr:unnamed protein product [Miscanthus lutarioriparius]
MTRPGSQSDFGTAPQPIAHVLCGSIPISSRFTKKKTARSVRNPTGAAPLTPPARHHPAPIGATPHPSGGRSQGVDKADLQGWGWVREAQVPGLTLAIWSNVGEAKQPDIHVACWGAWSPMRSNHSYHSHGSCSAGGTQS